MKFYLLTGRSISAHSELPKVKPKATLVIRSRDDLDAKRFPLKRINDIWASLPLKGSRRPFRNRDSGVSRLWDAFDQLPCSDLSKASKIGKVINLIKRPEGASIDEIAQLTGWQRHSIRGALSGYIRKKMGFELIRVKSGDRTAYKFA